MFMALLARILNCPEALKGEKGVIYPSDDFNPILSPVELLVSKWNI